MLETLELKKSFKGLKPFSWTDIPRFCVVSGENGSGKTALLELINGAQSNPGQLAVVSPGLSSLNGKIRYIPANFTPGDIGQNAQNAEQQVAAKALQMANQLKNGPINNPPLQRLHGEVVSRLRKRTEDGGQNADKTDLKHLSDAEMLDLLPTDFSTFLQDYQNNEFIAEVFVSYQKLLTRRTVQKFKQGTVCSESDLIDEIGIQPPWLVINSLLSKYGFSYQINEPVDGMAYVPRFIGGGAAQPIAFNELSSGERVIVTLVLWAFNSRMSLHKSLLLLDEFDAHLNPALSSMMIEIISNQLVGEFGLQVIMTTHSPSTVAHTPEDALFWIERGQSIRKVSKGEAISRLSNGFIALRNSQVGDIFHIEATENSSPFLCVEGPTDKIILTQAWQKLRPDRPLPVNIHHVFDCWFLSNMFSRGDIFKNYPEASFFGLLDFDDAYTKTRHKFEKEPWERIVNPEGTQVVYNHQNGKGVLLTLPVPSHRKTYAGPEMRNSYLSIELLFEDQYVAQYCNSESVAGGGEVLRFRDKSKTAFAKRTADLDHQAFAPFEPLLAKLESLCLSN